MNCEVRSPDGRLLYTLTELDRALRAQRARRVLPDWMHAVYWPAGMVDALRAARANGNTRALRLLLYEARMLADAESYGLSTAATAIRHCLRDKYSAV